MAKSFFDWELEFRKKKKDLQDKNSNKKNSLGIPEIDFKKVMDKYKRIVSDKK